MKTELLNPQNSALILIDFQPQMTFGVANIDRQTLFNNVMLLAKAAKIFNVPTVLTTVETKSFSGNFWPQVLDIFPDQEPVERSSMNSWEDAGLVEAVVLSVRVVFANFTPAIFWAFLLSTIIIGSILLLPLLPLTLPWMAYASRALYRQVLPTS